MDKQLQLRAILLGGIIAGVLSSIPGLGMGVNCCCCGGFYSIGGFIASYYIIYRTRVYPSDADAAIAGLGVGVLAGTISGTINTLSQLLFRPDPEEVMENVENLLQLIPPHLQDTYRDFIEKSLQAPPAPGIIFSMIMMVALAAAVGALAAFIGMRLLRPLRTMEPLAPPRPSWGQYYYQYPPGYYPPQPQAPTQPGAPPAPTPPAGQPAATPHSATPPPAAWTPAPAPKPEPRVPGGEAKPWGGEPSPPKSDDEGDQGP